uniref:Uncharacterized protein n=1 Tax=Glossina austeni TaxID=7395 RepID=A0A1A9UDG3_GLOAU
MVLKYHGLLLLAHLKLYFICPSNHKKLENYRWFQQFQTKGHPRKFRTSVYQKSQNFESENLGDRVHLKMTISRISMDLKNTSSLSGSPSTYSSSPSGVTAKRHDEGVESK